MKKLGYRQAFCHRLLTRSLTRGCLAKELIQPVPQHHKITITVATNASQMHHKGQILHTQEYVGSCRPVSSRAQASCGEILGKAEAGVES